jgi:hypothetical protein
MAVAWEDDLGFVLTKAIGACIFRILEEKLGPSRMLKALFALGGESNGCPTHLS